MAPKVTTRSYLPDALAVAGSVVDVLSFGVVPPRTDSRVMVIDATISGVRAAGDIGLGISISSDRGVVLPGTLYYSVFGAPEDYVYPVTPFAEVGPVGVVDVGFRSDFITNYVALMVRSQSKAVDCGCLVMKWFFGFDPIT